MDPKVQKVQKKTASAYSNNIPGFTFIEIMVALALIALLATIVLPALNRFRPGYARKELISRIQGLIHTAWNTSLSEHVITRVLWDREKKMLTVEKKAKKNEYITISSPYLETRYDWPDNIQIKDFFIDGTNEMYKPGKKVEQIWFYIYADGTTQDVIINLFDTTDASQSQAGSRVSVVLNPFTTMCAVYDTFQRP